MVIRAMYATALPSLSTELASTLRTTKGLRGWTGPFRERMAFRMIGALTLSEIGAPPSLEDDDTSMPRSTSMPPAAPALPARLKRAPTFWYWIVLMACPLSVIRELVTIGTSEPMTRESPESRTDWLARYIGLIVPSAVSA